MRKPLNHKLALITGASSGLGTNLAIECAERGISLLLTGRNQSHLSNLASYLRPHVDVTFFPCDLNAKEDRERLLFEIHEKAPDLVINNAGCGLYGPALSYRTDDSLEMFSVNADAVLEITLEAARTLHAQKKEGVILNVSSVAAYFTFPYLAVYGAAKEFVRKFSKSFDAEMRDYGIRILASCPGQIDTPFSCKASCGYFRGKRGGVMTKEFAAKRILRQIEKKKPVDVFDFRYRLSTFSRLLPEKILLPFFKKSMEKRFQHREILPPEEKTERVPF